MLGLQPVQLRFLDFSVIICCALLYTTSVSAVDQITVQIGDLQAADWNAKGVSLKLPVLAGRPSEVEEPEDHITLSVLTLHHSAFPEPWEAIQIQCRLGQQGPDLQRCIDGFLSIQQGPFGPQKARLNMDYQGQDQWGFSLKDLAIAGGSVDADLRLERSAWKTKTVGKKLSLKQLGRLLFKQEGPEGWSMAGTANLTVTASGQDLITDKVVARLHLNDLGYSSPDGLQVAEKVGAKIELTAGQATKGPHPWKGAAKISVSDGQIYSDPVFIQILPNKPMELVTDFGWDSVDQLIRLSQVKIQWPDVMGLQGNLAISMQDLRLQQARLELRAENLGVLYSQLLQPFLIGQILDDLEVVGQAEANLLLDAQGLASVSVGLEDLYLDHKKGLFGLYGAAGKLYWARDEQAKVSRFSLAGGHASKIDFGSLDLGLQLSQDSASLASPLSVPVLGGSVIFPSFEASDIGGPQQQAKTGVMVKDISMLALSNALGWPAFKGSMSGNLPEIQYQNDQVKITGGLSLSLFGGLAVLTNLTVHEPFSLVPRLEADAFMQNLDLQQITSAFSFGQIEGSFNGEVRNLELVGWSPSRFKARFFSPEKDVRRHKISQGAVDDLTALGNGVSGALSGTFLRFFDDFSYDRIELRVDLKDNMAILDGIAHSSGGYYLVKGAGLPRIDVIGRTRQIAWKDLVDRLQDIRFDGVTIR